MSPKPEYCVKIECSDCKQRGRECSFAPDLDGNLAKLAYRNPNYRGDKLKEWCLEIDFCSIAILLYPDHYEAVKEVLRTHMSDQYMSCGVWEEEGKGTAEEPFCADELLRDLENLKRTRPGVTFKSTFTRSIDAS